MPEHTSRLSTGDRLSDRYEIAERIGSGAVAEVFRAHDRSTGRDVALKVRKHATDASAPDSLEAEAHSCARVSHPNVAGLIDVGTTLDGEPFLVFEFVEGRTLRDLIDERGAIEPAVAFRWMGEILDALAAVHAQGIVHRDVKPENVMIACPGIIEHAILLDLGLGARAPKAEAAADQGAELAGTPRYAAPEQLRGEAATPRSDLYSWGLVLLECLTGTSAVRADSARDATEEQLRAGPVPIPVSWENSPVGVLIRAVTSKDADRRPENAACVLAMLADAVPFVRSIAGTASLPADQLRRATVVSARLARAPLEESRPFLCTEYAAIEETCRRTGGSIVSAVGGRVTAVFGLRYPDHRHCEHALDFAEEVALRSLPDSDAAAWCLGVHTGRLERRPPPDGIDSVEVLLDPTCARSAALDEIAPPGRIVVSDEIENVVRDEWVSSVQAGKEQGAFRLRRRRSRDPRISATPPMTGRLPEIECIREAWKATTTKGTNALFLIGRAGIGKSRLVRETRGFADGADWLEFRCTTERQSIPFGGVMSLVEVLGADALTLARRYRLPPTEAVPILATLLGEPMPDGYSMPPVTPERYRELVERTVLQLLVEVADDGPTVIVAEDLHWADASSLEFVAMLVAEMSRAIQAGRPIPLLLLLTSRPEFASTWNPEGLVRVELQPLPAGEVEQMAQSALPARGIDPDVVKDLVDASGGLPLFVEQATRLIANRITAESEDRQLPRSMDDVLAAQIALLGEDACTVAQTAAAIGHYFDGELVGIAASIPDSALRCALKELADAGIATRSAGGGPNGYAFTHVLLREAAYRSVPDADRAPLHRKIARAMQESHPQIGVHRPAELALQLEMAQEPGAAAELWHRAGMQAMATAGYPEACDDLERGIRLLEPLPDSSERTMRLLALHTGLGSAHVMMRGFSAPEARSAFQTASRMCSKAGRDVPLEVLGGLFGAALVAADREELDAVLPHFRTLAERTDSPIFAFSGHQVLSVEAYWNGRLDEAWQHAEISMDLYRREAVQGVAWEFGFGIHCYAYGMLSLFHRGFSDQAESVRLEMRDRARRNGNPHCMAVALGWSTILLLAARRAEETIDESNRLIRLAEEQHLPLWATYATISRGAMMAETGDVAAAVPAVRNAMDRLDAMGAFVNWLAYSPYWARVLLAAGDVEEARTVVRYAMQCCERVWPRVQEPELVRLHGVILERMGRGDEADKEFRRALMIARSDGNVAAQGWILENAPKLASATPDARRPLDAPRINSAAR